jgi:hypothetical protein
MDGVGPAIAGSGMPLADLPAVAMQFPTLSSFRPLSGSYRSVAQHPRVFTTTAELQELAARINRPGSYSTQRFSRLAAQIKQDLASTTDWSAAYSGCRMVIYLYAFSYEPQDGDAAQTVHSTLQLGPNVKAAAGAAVVAARIPVLLPWTVFSEYVIYGKSDSPLECFANTGPDAFTSHPGFVTPNVAAGEVQDRYRNNTPLQGFGYPMFTLERLIDAAEVMRIAGFDSYGYRGQRGQSIEMALGYYACFGKGAGFGRTVTAGNSGSCPNAAQYVGRVVSGVDQNEAFGAYRFPGNNSITDVEAAAKISASGAANTFSTDAILFGKWRD